MQIPIDTLALRQQIFTRLDALSTKLGVAAEHVWNVLIRQAYAEAGMSFANLLFALIVLFVICGWVKKSWGKPGTEKTAYGNTCLSEEQLFYRIISACALVIVVIWSIVALSWAIDGVGYLINPEYFALKSIFGLLK